MFEKTQVLVFSTLHHDIPFCLQILSLPGWLFFPNFFFFFFSFWSCYAVLFSYIWIVSDICFFLQYIHGLAARGVHYLHRPGPMLQDVGFYFLQVWINFFFFLGNVLLICRIVFLYLIFVWKQELGQDKAYISETLFSLIFLSFFLVRFFCCVCYLAFIYLCLISSLTILFPFEFQLWRITFAVYIYLFIF